MNPSLKRAKNSLVMIVTRRTRVHGHGVNTMCELFQVLDGHISWSRGKFRILGSWKIEIGPGSKSCLFEEIFFLSAIPVEMKRGGDHSVCQLFKI